MNHVKRSGRAEVHLLSRG